ncbi:MAG: SAM hydrolase/SAM-dependent halogenase family protein, partial [Halobacteriota archaeon]
MITLASDFGSPYPAAMKGVILDRCDARLVDVTHRLPRQDVRAGAFWLRETLPYFPPAVHLAVVDPGVGTDRGVVVLRVGDHAFVAPDNGLVVPATRRVAAENDTSVEAFAVDHASPASSTFHGRDVFAPIAAAVHEVGVDAIGDMAEASGAVESVSPTTDSVDLRLPAATIRDDGERVAVDGEVLVVDDFGNVVTNVPGDVVAGRDEVAIDDSLAGGDGREGAADGHSLAVDS